MSVDQPSPDGEKLQRREFLGEPLKPEVKGFSAEPLSESEKLEGVSVNDSKKISQLPQQEVTQKKSQAQIDSRKERVPVRGILLGGAVGLFLAAAGSIGAGIVLISHGNSAGGGVFGAGGSMMGACVTVVNIAIGKRKDSDNSEES